MKWSEKIRYFETLEGIWITVTDSVNIAPKGKGYNKKVKNLKKKGKKRK
jgi:hypothetical protein